MSTYNYVVTIQKPTSVTHSCVGNFTGPEELNLIIAKCTRIEIHLHTPGGLQLMLDVPIHGRIATLELFRARGETQDLLFIVTERYKYCVLQWDDDAKGVVTRATGDVSDRIGRPPDLGQIGIIDPDSRLIGLHLYDGFFKVIPFGDEGQLQEAFNIKLEELLVLDIKFLHGCPKPTIAVLYKDDNKDARHVKTYEVSLKDKRFVDGPWLSYNFDKGAFFLIPVPPPSGGVLIIGGKKVAYCNAFTEQIISTRSVCQSFTLAYGRVDAVGSRYLLGDIDGLLYMLVMAHEEEKVTGLDLERLGETSIASTISCLDDAHVYVGSSFGNSQLIKLNPQPDATSSKVKVLERYVNFGPIADFCVADLGRQVVTCSGADIHSSLCIARNLFEINELASLDLEGIKGMWSLRSDTDPMHDEFLVVSFISETRIFQMILEGEAELRETEVGGFCSKVQTLFCHDAVDNQLVQVTSSSVRLVSLKLQQLRHEWHAPAGYFITVSTANTTQVLLAARGGRLVYLEIGDGILVQGKSAQLKYDISCLDISPVGENSNYSKFAAVGMWTDVSVKVLSLPDLNIMSNVQLGGEVIPRSVLLCAFEGIPYLLCALGDGHLLNFLLDTRTGKLTVMKKVSLATQPIALRKFSSKNTTLVFAASDRTAVIYSSNKKILYSDVNPKETSHMCPFNPAGYSDSVAIAKEGELSIGTIDDIQKLHIRKRPFVDGTASRICHQEQSCTFALCSLTTEAYGKCGVHLLDDQTFEVKSTHELDLYEYGCSILSCSFADDDKVYYCVGTVYAMPEENKPIEGRILIFTVEDMKLQLVAEEKTKGGVYSLNAFKNKLLAAINQEIHLYKWMLHDDGTRELQSECKHHGHILAYCVQTRGDFIIVGDLRESISLLIYEEGAIKEQALDYKAKRILAVEILDDDIYLGADYNLNLFTARKNSEGTTVEDRGRLEVVGGYHLGEYVNRFQRGSLASLTDADVGQIPTIIFGTVNGVIGLIVSLPEDQYMFMEKLQTNLRKFIKGIGGLSHEEWRSFYNEKKTVSSRNFLDGDLIESFLNLGRSQMENISAGMDVSVEEAVKRVRELTKLHSF